MKHKIGDITIKDGVMSKLRINDFGQEACVILNLKTKTVESVSGYGSVPSPLWNHEDPDRTYMWMRPNPFLSFQDLADVAEQEIREQTMLRKELESEK